MYLFILLIFHCFLAMLYCRRVYSSSETVKGNHGIPTPIELGILLGCVPTTLESVIVIVIRIMRVIITTIHHPPVITIDSLYVHHSQSWVVYGIVIPTLLRKIRCSKNDSAIGLQCIFNLLTLCLPEFQCFFPSAMKRCLPSIPKKDTRYHVCS